MFDPFMTALVLVIYLTIGFGSLVSLVFFENAFRIVQRFVGDYVLLSVLALIAVWPAVMIIVAFLALREAEREGRISRTCIMEKKDRKLIHFITGASSGLGLATVKALMMETPTTNDFVIAIGHKTELLAFRERLGEVPNERAKLLYIPADLRSEESLTAQGLYDYLVELGIAGAGSEYQPGLFLLSALGGNYKKTIRPNTQAIMDAMEHVAITHNTLEIMTRLIGHMKGTGDPVFKPIIFYPHTSAQAMGEKMPYVLAKNAAASIFESYHYESRYKQDEKWEWLCNRVATFATPTTGFPAVMDDRYENPMYQHPNLFGAAMVRRLNEHFHFNFFPFRTIHNAAPVSTTLGIQDH